MIAGLLTKFAASPWVRADVRHGVIVSDGVDAPGGIECAMVVLVTGFSGWSVVEVAKFHLDHTSRWPSAIKPSPAMTLHHLRGR